MKRTVLSLTLALGTLAALAQANGASLNTRAFGKLMKKNHALVVDVRTAGEFAQGHLEGAAQIDWKGGTLLKDLSAIDRSAPVLLYCGSGVRSGEAKAALIGAGFPNVYDLAGGMEAWEQAGKPVISQ
ncbi:MAG: rhodanese-like domain-containing protein [Flavobacteriales bacterium]|nr:rhodanese-like domain-containing protein [Flavobacteriales bacterium]MBP9080517.1 rhodanese-like domain-containing protein [Flavobacteriales bacterium]